jgi:hypothetical protein
VKVFITKYALTTGIYVAEAEWDKDSPNMVVVRKPGELTTYFHGMDWHRDWESAERDAYEKVDRAIKSARKKIEKLDRITFKDPSAGV